jgi:uncharacterized Rmd1/YagE family protein
MPCHNLFLLSRAKYPKVITDVNEVADSVSIKKLQPLLSYKFSVRRKQSIHSRRKHSIKSCINYILSEAFELPLLSNFLNMIEKAMFL